MKRSEGLYVCLLFGLGFVYLSGGVACGHLNYRLNEESAQASTKAIRYAERRFASENTERKFGTLQELAESALIDSQLTTGTKDGYRFNLNVSGQSYKFTAVPVTYDQSGSWSFYVDESGIVRGTADNRQATANDVPVRYQE